MNYQQHPPAVEECEELAVGLAQIDVDASGLGHGGTQLGEGQRPGERQHAAHDPDQDQLRNVAASRPTLWGPRENPEPMIVPTTMAVEARHSIASGREADARESTPA